MTRLAQRQAREATPSAPGPPDHALLGSELCSIVLRSHHCWVQRPCSMDFGDPACRHICVVTLSRESCVPVPPSASKCIPVYLSRGRRRTSGRALSRAVHPCASHCIDVHRLTRCGQHDSMQYQLAHFVRARIGVGCPSLKIILPGWQNPI